MGLVGAVVSIVGVFVASDVADKVSGPIGELFAGSVGSAAIASVVAYVVVGAVVFAAVQFVGYLVSKFLKMIFLGWANTLGGAVAGAFAGVLVGAIIVLVFANLAFMASGSSLDVAPQTGVRQGLEDALVESSLASAYVETYYALPASTQGIVPNRFQQAIQELERTTA